jgi:hypothetical protein
VDELLDRDPTLLTCLFGRTRTRRQPLSHHAGLPEELSDEFRSDLQHSLSTWSSWAELARVTWAPLMLWPVIQVELWWEQHPGGYVLKRRDHRPSLLDDAEFARLFAEGSLDKAPYRYIAKRELAPIAVNKRWLCLFTVMRLWAQSSGPEGVRLAVFFE